jgi:hypothetical protein
MNIAGRLDAAKNSSHQPPEKLDKSTTIRLENQYGPGLFCAVSKISCRASMLPKCDLSPETMYVIQ